MVDKIMWSLHVNASTEEVALPATDYNNILPHCGNKEQLTGVGQIASHLPPFLVLKVLKKFVSA